MKTLKQLEEEIKLLAYELYEKNGRVDGHDMDHWLEAERVVMSRYFGALGEPRDNQVAQEPVGGKPRRQKQTGSRSSKSRKVSDK